MNEIDGRLIELQDAKRKLSKEIGNREVSYGFWTVWKHYAQNYDWYDDFIHAPNNIPWSELKYHVKAQGAFQVTRAQGQKLWDERKQILQNIKEIEETIDLLLEDMFCKDDVPLKDIAKYYGASPSAAYQYMKERPWFVRRSDSVKA